ncbi:hypothetical protein GCM10022384_67490 [Streptomyces marokkonensis]|uniref:3-methyl-2-oxobutanoate hydroxymethyltransferase n=1 Tax=Streptomyces marokkonensis TaxID=324855 RepID=A0ABP7SM60_9ACTN
MTSNALAPAALSTHEPHEAADAIRPYLHRYTSPAKLGIKVNLYRDIEVEGLAQALRAPDLADCPVECLMVGDSYFMTHLGRPGTAMRDDQERAWALEVMLGLVAEVHASMGASLPRARRPFLLADLPDGAADTIAGAASAAERFMAAGADAVKIEAVGPESLYCAEAVAKLDIPTVVHLGYTPQRGDLTRRGNTIDDAAALFAEARRARDAGACGLVLEMVSEPVNAALSRPGPGSLPVYSVFSGRAEYGGYSLNVWDAVVRSAVPRQLFPPTPVIDVAQVPERYTPDLLADRLGELLRMTVAGDFPRHLKNRMSPDDQQVLADTDPWSQS